MISTIANINHTIRVMNIIGISINATINIMINGIIHISIILLLL